MNDFCKFCRRSAVCQSKDASTRRWKQVWFLEETQYVVVACTPTYKSGLIGEQWVRVPKEVVDAAAQAV